MKVSALNFISLKPNVSLHLKDINNLTVGVAEVGVWSDGRYCKSVSDIQGRWLGYAVPSMISTLEIKKKGYLPYQQKFMLINKAYLDESDNKLLIILHDDVEKPIVGANVELHHKFGVERVYSGAEGMVSVNINSEYDYKVLITGENILLYEYSIYAHSMVSSMNEGFVAVPVINLKSAITTN